MFFSIIGLVLGAIGSANNAAATRDQTKAIKDIKNEPLPAAYQAQLNAVVTASQQEQAAFDASIAQQKKLITAAELGGAGLLVIYLLTKI